MEGENNNMSGNEVYKECLRNHAASLGSYATDGCGEFTLHDTAAAASSPLSLQCAACGCHRNFHRKLTAATSSYMVDEYGGDHRLRQPSVGPEERRSGGGGRKRHRTKFTAEQKEEMMGFAEKLGWRLHRHVSGGSDEVERFCRGIGISRHVFKVWMHNHKNSSNISSISSPPLDLYNNNSSTSINATTTTTANASSLTTQ
ncbi:unnamed protein product [Linum trigynum]|uniref:ZF-HD dimerization-type domain-containing protein n=1 Tax=Linum trigynum TaxID=586398 RepID=A0AAV2D737_9ROSI